MLLKAPERKRNVEDFIHIRHDDKLPVMLLSLCLLFCARRDLVRDMNCLINVSAIAAALGKHE